MRGGESANCQKNNKPSGFGSTFTVGLLLFGFHLAVEKRTLKKGPEVLRKGVRARLTSLDASLRPSGGKRDMRTACRASSGSSPVWQQTELLHASAWLHPTCGKSRSLNLCTAHKQYTAGAAYRSFSLAYSTIFSSSAFSKRARWALIFCCSWFARMYSALFCFCFCLCAASNSSSSSNASFAMALMTCPS